ncbi:MAG: hypothetical protein CMO14_00085 [Thaumarchaeota archaeon]|jgi:hypothetical protein|nr:hypothetical protein [Nitrososphaerota archaeon]|tara:strand:- start:1083 stop:1529 length:447 start_codon:yes stop_codon:yes gene_type:complete
MEKSYHADTLKKSVIIAANLQKTWNVVSKIVDLKWLDNIKTAKFLSAKTRGIGATRHISFIDGTNVEEIIVGWKPKKYFSYIAISGLPLRGYHATITITAKNKNSVIVEWQSFFSSELMTKSEFREFHKLLSNFYSKSLKNLRISLEK